MDSRELMVQQLPSLNRYAASLAHSRVRADDLVQETVVRALTHLHRWQAGSDMRAWLFSIMHNEYVNSVRRSVRDNRLVHEFPPVSIHGNQESSVELADLQWAFDQLPYDLRKIIFLVTLEGLRYDAVAAVLDLPIGTVRSRLSRGRKRLRELLEGHGTPPSARRYPPRWCQARGQSACGH